jgi:antitoxin FitA
MCSACKYAVRMSKMIQIRNVPDFIHRTLKSRAALAGMSLSDYLLQIVRESAECPTLEEMRERLRRREPINLPVSAAEIIRAERDSR